MDKDLDISIDAKVDDFLSSLDPELLKDVEIEEEQEEVKEEEKTRTEDEHSNTNTKLEHQRSNRFSKQHHHPNIITTTIVCVWVLSYLCVIRKIHPFLIILLLN